MKRVVFLLVLLVVTANSYAQFKLETGAYDRQKREALETKRVQDSLRRVEFENQLIKENDIRYRLKWVNWVKFSQSIGFIESNSILSYSGYLATKQTWTLPITLKLSSARRYNEAALMTGYQADGWKKYLLDLGMSGFRNLKNDFYLSLGGQLPLGWERYRLTGETSADRKHTHLIAGIGAEERVFYMSPNKVGLVLGVGFYQGLMTSRLYHFDMGLTFEVGVKF
jgi:hypothetical protein